MNVDAWCTSPSLMQLLLKVSIDAEEVAEMVIALSCREQSARRCGTSASGSRFSSVQRYSVLSATVGSILRARRVGTTQASMHTPNISAA